MNEELAAFEEDKRPDGVVSKKDFVLSLDGFEGPIDILLNLTRQQKVDLTQISILELAEQYLEFVSAARSLQIELAADYLVMAAWLVFLKSRLLLPSEEDEQPSGEEMAEVLKFQLRRLEGMQKAGRMVLELPRRGVDFFPRGAPEGVPTKYRSVYDVSLYDLLKAYGRQRSEGGKTALEIEPLDLFSIDDAVIRLRRILGTVPEWMELKLFLPKEPMSPLMKRSAISSTLVAVLELVRQGKADVRQDGGICTPIFVRSMQDGSVS